MTEQPRQLGFELACKLSEVLRGPDDHEINGAEPVALVGGQFPKGGVQALEAERVPVEVVQEQRVDQLPENLKG